VWVRTSNIYISINTYSLHGTKKLDANDMCDSYVNQNEIKIGYLVSVTDVPEEYHELLVLSSLASSSGTSCA